VSARVWHSCNDEQDRTANPAHFSNAILTFVVSICECSQHCHNTYRHTNGRSDILGFAFGPIVLAPISEMFGRLIVYNVSNVLFLCFTVGCALSTSWNMLIGFRFLAGCLGVAPITLGGGTIADLMAVEQRGAAMAIWAIGRKLCLRTLRNSASIMAYQ